MVLHTLFHYQLVAVLLIYVQQADQQECMYEYIEQPAESVIDCNPYGTVLNLQCAITAPLDEEVNINWYQHNDNITTQLINQLQTATEDLTSLTVTFRSVLTLTDIQPAVDTGDYYCQAVINSSNLLRSDSFTLSSDENDFIEFLSVRDCESRDIFYTSVTKCADLLVPIVTPSHSTHSTIPIQATQTTQLRITPSHTSSMKVPLLSSSKAINTSGTISNPTAAPEVGVGIYITIGVIAVFGLFFLVISIILIVALYLLKRKQKDILTQTRSLPAEYEVPLNSGASNNENRQTFTVKSNDAYTTTTMADSRPGTTVEEQLRMSSNEAYSTAVEYNEDNEDNEYDYIT